MTTGADIMQQVGILLGDEEHVRWTPAELRLWINDACKAIVLVKPSARSETRILSLAAGTLQSVTAIAGAPTPLALLNIVRNITDVGPPRVGGRVVKVTSQTQMDAADPYWQDPARNRPTKEVRQFIYDEQSPLEFYVYPPNDGTGKVEALCSQVPDALPVPASPDAAASYVGVIDLPEIYDPVIVDYVCYRTQIKDSTGGDSGNAASAYQRFASAMGIKIQVEGGSSPNARRVAQ